jgi:hypothetical protein
MTENNAIIRVDIRMWKQYFLKGGMFPESENILVFYTAKSIVDHTKLTIDELVYYMTEMAGPNATLKTVIDFVKEIKLLWGQLEEKPLTHVVDNYNSTDQPILV